MKPQAADLSVHKTHFLAVIPLCLARADPVRGRLISDSHNYRKHEAVARDLERAFGHAPVDGAHIGRQGDGQRRKDRPPRTPGHDEMQQAARSGLTPAHAKAQVTALWRRTATGQAFASALKDSGWTLCRGDRRDFVLLDPAGNVHSLARRVQGARTADISAKMKDVDPMTLPGVSEARSAIRKATGSAAAEVTRFPARRHDPGRPQRWAA